MPASPSTPIVVIGIPGHKRVQLFLAAAQPLNRTCHVVDWQDVLATVGGDPSPWADCVPEGATVRLESPGQCFAVEKQLLKLGGGLCRTSPLDIASLQFDRGAILSMHQWYLGWCCALAFVEKALESRHVQWMNHPRDIIVMFDKAACRRRLLDCNLPVPASLGVLSSFEDVIECMEREKMRRIFIKPCSGSSASGVIALQIGAGGRIQAQSPMEMVMHPDGDVSFYNSRKVRVFRDLNEIRRLVSFVCRQRGLTERWMPKATLDGLAFDLRIIVIAGKASHVAVRMSRHPMTNLHLGAQRGDIGRLRQVVGEPAWNRCLRVAEDAMARAFPQCLYAGLDVMMTTGVHRPYILEVNAFGDLMPNLPSLTDDADTYTRELLEWERITGEQL
ncbi:MAG: STM4014 family protein [Candidatus Methylacidiphilales bacterium]